MQDPHAIDVDAVAAAAFALADELHPGGGHWHAHGVHQLLYAARGVLTLEVDGARWTLPSARAAWISAGTRHRVDVSAPAALRTVYFSPSIVPPAVEDLGDCSVFAVSPLVREMVLHSMRWGADRAPDDARADRFFAALADCCHEWMSQTRPFVLPRARTEPLKKAMESARSDLAAATAAGAARAAGLSTRSLSRRFRDEIGITWRRWLRTARILQAMESLASPSTNVTETALAVGFDSPAAFTHAFREMVGEAPSAFARRVRGDTGSDG